VNLWLMVSNDRYELPLAVAGSAAELARIVGVNKGFIASHASKVRNGTQKKARFIKVEIDEEVPD